jgi:hypothetical protein
MKNLIQLFGITLVLLPFYFFLYKIFSVRALSFGCFDDCGNYMAGYFMNQGKTLYSEIFYNHIMGAAWLSYFIQKFHNSINIYDLVLVHRQVILFISFLFSIFFIKRFGWLGLFFVVVYELSKFYFFGDRFLAESIVVFAASYLLGVLFYKYQYNKQTTFDLIFPGFLTFLIIFLREPYIPLALFLYLAILFGKQYKREKTMSILIFLFLILAVLVNTQLADFIFNDFTVNMQTAIKGEIGKNNTFGIGIIQVFTYPVFTFFYGKLNALRFFEIALSITFLFGIAFTYFKKRKKLLVFLLVFSLALANIRVTPPGTAYYEAYHMLVWYGMFTFITFALLKDLFIKYKRLSIGLSVMVFASWLYLVFFPGSYLYNKIDLQEQLLTNFGNDMNIGNVINHLSESSDTLFLDGGDDMIYWVSKRNSPYRYSLYTGVMPQIPLYKNARIAMFRSDPPDFFYDFCSPNAPYNSQIPSFIKPSYVQLLYNGKPSCLYVREEKMKKISPAQWKTANDGFFSLPPSKENKNE